MAKYRIRIEAVDPEAVELTAEKRIGYECDGYAIIVDQGKTVGTVIKGMYLSDIANGIALDDEMIQAACIARGMAEGRWFAEKIKATDMLRRIMGRGEDEA